MDKKWILPRCSSANADLLRNNDDLAATICLLIDNLEYSVGYKKYTTKASDRINKYKKRAERMQEREARTDLANRPQKKKRQGKVHQRS